VKLTALSYRKTCIDPFSFHNLYHCYHGITNCKSF